jgi:uncharacterized RDD family membrane protein YckC
MDTPIYIAREGKQIGPFPAHAIASMIDKGELSVDDFFWRTGMADWQNLSEWESRANAPAEVFSRTGAALPTLPPVLGEHPGFGRRAVAHIIDCAIVYLLTFVGGIVMALFGAFDENLLSLFSLLTAWLYVSLMESSSKQASLGKMALGFVVTDLSGQRISFLRASARYFAMILSTLTFFIGFLMCIFTRRKQCLHDMIAGCVMRTKI